MCNFSWSPEMCDFIRTENIKTVIEHIVTKHLHQQPPSSSEVNDVAIKRTPSLEDFATPYVDTLTLLRHKYEENSSVTKSSSNESPISGDPFSNDNQRLIQNEKAREDQVRIYFCIILCNFLDSLTNLVSHAQRKFREADAEDSYFFDDTGPNEQSHARPLSPALLSPHSRTGMNI